MEAAKAPYPATRRVRRRPYGIFIGHSIIHSIFCRAGDQHGTETGLLRKTDVVHDDGGCTGREHHLRDRVYLYDRGLDPVPDPDTLLRDRHVPGQKRHVLDRRLSGAAGPRHDPDLLDPAPERFLFHCQRGDGHDRSREPQAVPDLSGDEGGSHDHIRDQFRQHTGGTGEPGAERNVRCPGE